MLMIVAYCSFVRPGESPSMYLVIVSSFESKLRKSFFHECLILNALAPAEVALMIARKRLNSRERG